VTKTRLERSNVPSVGSTDVELKTELSKVEVLFGLAMTESRNMKVRKKRQVSLCELKESGLNGRSRVPLLSSAYSLLKAQTMGGVVDESTPQAKHPFAKLPFLGAVAGVDTFFFGFIKAAQRD
jgi:hypothetical protein